MGWNPNPTAAQAANIAKTQALLARANDPNRQAGPLRMTENQRSNLYDFTRAKHPGEDTERKIAEHAVRWEAANPGAQGAQGAQQGAQAREDQYRARVRATNDWWKERNADLKERLERAQASMSASGVPEYTPPEVSYQRNFEEAAQDDTSKVPYSGFNEWGNIYESSRGSGADKVNFDDSEGLDTASAFANTLEAGKAGYDAGSGDIGSELFDIRKFTTDNPSLGSGVKVAKEYAGRFY